MIKIKILHICQYYNDGWGYQENLLPKYQAKLGHEVVVVTSDRRPYYAGDSNPRIVGTGTFYDNGIRVERLPIKWEFRNRFVVFKNLFEKLEEEKPDYIFFHGLTSPALATVSYYKKKQEKTFVAVDSHSDLTNSARKWLWRKIYYEGYWKAKIRKYIDYIDLVFGVTPARCHFVQYFLGIPENKLRLLPIGADTSTTVDLLKNRKELRGEYGLSEQDIVLVTGGKLNSRKKLDELLIAIKGLNVKLLIFGKIIDEKCRKLLEKAENAIFFGWQGRINTLKMLSAADIAIWPGTHTTLMEDAIATQTPLIERYHGNTAHHIRGNGAYLFAATSIEIRQLLTILIENRELLKKMKSAALNQYKLLSYENIAKESIKYYYDRSPGNIHKSIMSDPLCNYENKGFVKYL